MNACPKELPDVLLPAQLDRTRPANGERQLALAVFQEAVDNLRDARTGRAHVETARQAEAWFASDERDWPFLFLPLCDLLGFDPSAIRRQLGVPREPIHAPLAVCLCGKPRHSGACLARRVARARQQAQYKARRKAVA